MEEKNYTIKDIARMAGVSAGTVDRVLHDRGDVSAKSMQKVKQVLDEIDYRPNKFAIGLAAKKRYYILCLIPHYVEQDYWHAVALGIVRAAEELRPFNVSVDYAHYRHNDRDSYEVACKRCVEGEELPDAVLLAPNFRTETRLLTARLDECEVPYAYIDFFVKQTHPLTYIGQDSVMSGYIAAKLLMQHWKEGEEVAVFQHNPKENPSEIQMQRRMEGFMQYLAETDMHPTLHDVLLSKTDTEGNRRVLNQFFATHPQVVLGAVFNSRVYQVAEYLHERGRRLAGMVGYDLLQRSVEHLKGGEVDYLIGQRPGLQGYLGVKALADKIVFKQTVNEVRYMPIDVLMKENIAYYVEFYE